MIPSVYQLDGSACEGSNCDPAATADAILFTTGGVKPAGAIGPWPPTGASIRRLSGLPCGSTNLPEMDLVANHGYATDMIVENRYPIASLNNHLAKGWGASCIVMYAPLHGSKFDASGNGFSGAHSVFRAMVGGQLWTSDPLADGRGRGIPKGPQLWPEALFEKTAFEYAGQGFVQCALVLPPHALVPRVRVVGPFTTYTIRQGRTGPFIYGSTAGRTAPYSTSYTCSQPVGIHVGGGTMFLVKLTSGPFAGSYVYPHGTLKFSE